MVYICAYRNWGINIFNKLKGIYDIVLIETPDQLTQLSNMFHKNDTIFFLGWSWIVDKNIIDNYNCICLHPSPLPKYRGGSPIQNQIINKEQVSAVSFFKMNDKLDQGKILYQAPFSLKGELNDIFNRIINHLLDFDVLYQPILLLSLSLIIILNLYSYKNKNNLYLFNIKII